MNDIITPEQWLAMLRARREELLHEADMVHARLAEVSDLLEAIETPPARRKPRPPRSREATDGAGTLALDIVRGPAPADEGSTPASQGNTPAG